MQWLVQYSGLPDQQSVKILEAAKLRNLPIAAFGVIPFTHEVIGLEAMDGALPSICYGSTQAAAQIATWKNFRPGAFYVEEWFDPRSWIGKRDDLLNEDQWDLTVGEVRDNWVKEPTFIKSVQSKKLTGMVIEPEKADRDAWLIEQSHLDRTELLTASPIHNIETECRFFVVEGKIVAGSTYRWLGCRSIRRPIDVGMCVYAEEAVKQWMPHQTIVIDICKLKNNRYKVIEFNSVNSSGFYNADALAFVDAIEATYNTVP